MPATPNIDAIYRGITPVDALCRGSTEVWTAFSGPTVAPVFKSYTAAASTSSSQAVVLPANVAGDLLIIGTNQRNSIGAVGAPVGWLKIADLTGHAHSLRTQLFAKISNGAEPNPTLTGLSTGGGLVTAQAWENASLPAEDGALDIFNRSNDSSVGGNAAFNYTFQNYAMNPTWVNPAREFDVVVMVSAGANDSSASFGGTRDGAYSAFTSNSNDSSIYFIWRAGTGTPNFSVYSGGYTTNNQAAMFIIPGV